MNKQFITIIALSLICVSSHAANETLIWGDSPKNVLKKPGIVAINETPHKRIQLRFKGIPVWGHVLIAHPNAKTAPKLYGMNVTGIEDDVASINPRLSLDKIWQIALNKIIGLVNYKTIEKVIFIDKNKKAHLAYHAAFYTSSKIHSLAAPNLIIDANSGVVLKKWNDIHTEKLGQGLGGNQFGPPYRSGEIQYGMSQKNIPSLGRFDVKVKKKNKCLLQSDRVKVIDIRDKDPETFILPVFRPLSSIYRLKTFSYACSKDSQYIHLYDDESGVMNYSYSSNNDAMYFVSKTIEMYEQYYKISKPLGADLPIRVYTHFKNFDNMMALTTLRIKGVILAHQQIIVGNGNELLTPSGQSVLAHEVSHNFTTLNSALVLEGQSGAINESFSDMAAIALQDYVSQKAHWYWNKLDWSIGRETTINGEALRYMDNPTQDGQSIDNANDYTDGLDVHRASGVFNKAFYLLATKKAWGVHKAFQLMVDANTNYWTPNTSFEAAACGAIQVAKDRHWNTQAVRDVFQSVGVSCPISL